MKMIVAVIKPHRLDQVRDALTEIGVLGLTVSEVRGYGRQGGHTEIYRGAEYQVDFVPKVKIEIVIDSDLVNDAIKIIQEKAGSGQIGDGKIFVLHMEQAIRIRTGESGNDAL